MVLQPLAPNTANPADARSGVGWMRRQLTDVGSRYSRTSDLVEKRKAMRRGVIRPTSWISVLLSLTPGLLVFTPAPTFNGQEPGLRQPLLRLARERGKTRGRSPWFLTTDVPMISALSLIFRGSGCSFGRSLLAPAIVFDVNKVPNANFAPEPCKLCKLKSTHKLQWLQFRPSE